MQPWDWARDPFPGLTVLTASVLIVTAIALPDDPGRLASWDMLLVSGILALVVGLSLARRAPVKLDHAVRRLLHRGALQGTHDAEQRIRQQLEARVQTWTKRGALVVAFSILGAFVVAMIRVRSTRFLPLAAFETYWAYIAGWHLGRMAAYGGLGAALRRAGVSVHAIPGHLDGAAGLKPIGDLFFFQSMVVAIPAIYLAAWLMLIPMLSRYDYWRPIYVPLLALSLVIELVAFLQPMWFFHVAMQQKKELLLEEADGLSERVAELELELAHSEQEQPRRELQQQLTVMTKRYRDIENMPTWPVDLRTRRYFTLSNMPLVLPLLTEAVGVADPWRRLMDAAARLFE